MTWPFENDTNRIVKMLAMESMKSERHGNLMVVTAVALEAYLICFAGVSSVSLVQMQRNQIVDTYQTVWQGIEETDIEILKGLPELARVGGYYMLGQELSKQGYTASYVYMDREMMYIARVQMHLSEGRFLKKTNEVVVSEYFLSAYGNNARVGVLAG